MKRLSLYFTGKCAVEVREEPLGDPGRGEALVETVCSAVSAGSELLFYQGLAPENKFAAGVGPPARAI
jgi:hypothetical protein